MLWVWSNSWQAQNINPFPNDKFQTLPNSKSLQTTISNLMKMAESFPNRSKTMWEKEVLLVKSNFPFPTLFSKDLYRRCMKNRFVLERVNIMEK